jgi:hypothetical protein
MKIITLSDHTKDKLQELVNKREADYMTQLTAYNRAIANMKAKQKQLRQNIKTAWQTLQVWQLCKGIVSLGWSLFATKPQPPFRRAASQEEHIWNSGRQGEQMVIKLLEDCLGDSWTLILGYRNAKGEIDQVIVGPYGIFAIEVKHINGVVHCNADQWWRDKYDRYNNLVERNSAIADKGGRSPSRQINESANSLVARLAKKTTIRRVQRAVVLSHSSARLGKLAHPTVDRIMLLNKRAMGEFIKSSPDRIDACEVVRAIEVIREDHTFHNQRRPQSRKGKPQRQRHNKPNEKRFPA